MTVSTSYLFGSDIAQICMLSSVPGVNLRPIPVAMWLPLTTFAHHVGSLRNKAEQYRRRVDISPLYETIYERSLDARPSHTTFSSTPTLAALPAFVAPLALRRHLCS
jgi:hypothetical protein